MILGNKSIVTGGLGFIGSHVVERLINEGHNVVIIDNESTGRRENIAHLETSKIEVINANIGEAGAWMTTFKDADYIFHLAALADIVPSIENPESYYHANVTGTLNVLQAARHAEPKKFVYAASSSCYGVPDTYPTCENEDISPMYPYALTKRMGEELILHWGQLYKLPVISLRLFNVYGTRSRTSGVYGAMFGVFLAQKLAGKPFTVVGDGEQTRDFIYVTDIADAFFTAATSDVQQEIFNIGTGNPISVNRVVELLDGPTIHMPKREGEPECTHSNSAKIKEMLGWSAQVSVDEGVANLMNEIEYWRNAPVWEPETIAEATQAWFKYLKAS